MSKKLETASVYLALFFLTMTIALGVKGPLDYSVFTSGAGSFLLASFYNKNAKI